MSNRFASLLTSLLLAAPLAPLAACAVEDDVTTSTTEGAASWSDLSARPSFELWKGSDGQFRFHLVDASADVLVTSEGYGSRASALNGLLSVLDNGGLSTRYDVRATASGTGAYFNLEAANGAIIATSQTYADAAAAQADVAATIAAVAAYAAAWDAATGERFAVRQDAGGKFYFNLHAGNGAIVLRSERYDSEAAALNGAFSVVDNGTTAARYQVRQAASGGYYFNLTATNGQIIATSEVYASKYNAERARDAVIALLPTVELL